MSSRSKVLTMVVSLALALGVGALGALSTTPNIEGWYTGLEKPGFNPPNSVFGPVWTTLYVMMAVAAWIVWKSDPGKPRRVALTLYGVQLALNAAWSPVFFGAHQLFPGLVVIAALAVTLALTVRAFFGISRVAGGLLVPYLAWVLFASALNAALWRLNA